LLWWFPHTLFFQALHETYQKPSLAEWYQITALCYGLLDWPLSWSLTFPDCLPDLTYRPPSLLSKSSYFLDWPSLWPSFLTDRFSSHLGWPIIFYNAPPHHPFLKGLHFLLIGIHRP
jgi:hypothetical protein